MSRAEMASHDYLEVPVRAVIAETDSAVSIVLDIPDSLQQLFAYQPGQFLTVRINIDGKFRHRCYSLSSAPGIDPRPMITVKRVEGGLVSNWLCSNVKPGSMLLVQPPSGHFVPHDLDRDVLLFAGGSGITPILSILKSVLNHGKGRAVLVYANRNEQSVIFAATLKALAQAYPERFIALHWLETVQGLPNAQSIAASIRGWSAADVFVCGPALYMDTVFAALDSLNVGRDRTHVERFVSLPDEEPLPTAALTSAPAEMATALSVLLDGNEHHLAWPPAEKLLDVMLNAGIDAPYSCRLGGCSACMCQVRDGAVRMANHPGLDARDIADGWILACQAYPTTASVRIEFAA